MKGAHLTDLYLNLALESPNRPVLHYKKGGSYLSISRGEFSQYCQSFALGLKRLGVAAGDRVAILSTNCPEWVISDMAIMTLGAVVVPIYPTLSSEEVSHVINDSGATWVLAEDLSQWQKICAVWDRLPELKGVILFSGQPESDDRPCQLFQDVLAKGESEESIARDELMRVREGLSSTDLASIIYTSGTTGPAKGVCLTHENFLANLEGISGAVTLTDSDRVLSFLPLSHVFERTAGYYLLLSIGGQIYYAESMETIADNLREVSPTVLVSVPRIYEKIQARIYQNLSGIKGVLFRWALAIGLKRLKLDRPGLIFKLRYWLANKLVFQKVRARVGGQLRFAVSGGAPLGQALGEFFQAVGILILEGYGLTETSPVISCNRLDAFRMGTVGKVLPNVTVRLADDGELCVKGPSVMQGYYKLPEKTADVLQDEWFHTGDIAEIDPDGFIRIVDRKKDLIVLSNGKKVAPQPIEQTLMTSRYVSQAILIGEKRNYITALIVPDWDALLSLAEREGWGQEKSTLSRHPSVIKYLEGIIQKKCHQLARFESVKKFVLLTEEFSLEAGHLTPSLKPKRPVIRSQYAEQIESLYEDKSEVRK